MKRDSWLSSVHGTNSKDASGTVWKKSKKLNGKCIASPLVSLKVDNNIITDPEEIAVRLGEHFASVSRPS